MQRLAVLECRPIAPLCLMCPFTRSPQSLRRDRLESDDVEEEEVGQRLDCVHGCSCSAALPPRLTVRQMQQAVLNYSELLAVCCCAGRIRERGCGGAARG